MMSSQTQDAMRELYRMVNHMPQPSNPVVSNGHPPQQSSRKSSQQLPQIPQQQSLRLPVHPQQNGGLGFKPMKPMEKRTATVKPQKPASTNQLNGIQNGQLMDPRLFFPAALQMSNNGVPKMPTLAPNALQMAPRMFAHNLPTTCAPYQLTPEMVAMMNGINGWNTMDPTMIAMMQQPAIFNKLYADYLACIQQQQQQYFQSFLLQSVQANTGCVKLNESPKVTPPNSNPPTMASTANGNLDPLASLHNMVHAQPKNLVLVEQKPQVLKKEELKTEPENADEDEEIIVDVGTTEQPMIVDVKEEQKADRNTPPSSAPPKIAGPSFSIAELLHQSSGAIDQLPTTTRTLTPINVLPYHRQDSADIPTSSSSQSAELRSPVESQDIIAMESQKSQSQSPTIKKSTDSAVPNKQRSAQRRKHVVEFHRRLKGITGRSKFSQCQLCGDIVDSNTSELTNHVYSHSKTGLFGCLKCDTSFKQKADLHNHGKLAHSVEYAVDPEQCHDLRDMGKLCDLLEKCFPRNSKLVIETLLNKLLKTCKGSEALRCRLCDKDVPSNVTSLKKHLEQHPRYRCKLCHFTNENECEQIKHGQEHHATDSPIYNVTSAAIVLSGTLNSCFSEYMPTEQQEFCEEMASIVSQDSPQGSPQQMSNGK